MIGSDGLPHDDHPHPRLWGTFPRVLGHYARELGLFPLETAVHKMTGLPAKTFRLKDRGRLARGLLRRPRRLRSRRRSSTAPPTTNPKQLSAGIDKVFVNGTLSYAAGKGVVGRAGRLVGGKN